MEAILHILLAIAASAALDLTAQNLSEKAARKKNLSSDDIINVINNMISEAKSKGPSTMNKLSNRLAKIQMPFGVSSSIKDKIISARQELSKQYEQYSNKYSTIENSLNNIEQRAQNLANQSPSYREEYGEGELEDIKKDAGDILSDFQKIEKGVEKYV